MSNQQSQQLTGNTAQGFGCFLGRAFYWEFFAGLDEHPFADLYVGYPSCPNATLNDLVSLEYLKSVNGWMDEEMYHHYLCNVQTRYTLGLHRLGDAHSKMRIIHNFRAYLSEYMQDKGINLLDQQGDSQVQSQVDRQ